MIGALREGRRTVEAMQRELLLKIVNNRAAHKQIALTKPSAPADGPCRSFGTFSPTPYRYRLSGLDQTIPFVARFDIMKGDVRRTRIMSP